MSAKMSSQVIESLMNQLVSITPVGFSSDCCVVGL